VIRSRDVSAAGDQRDARPRRNGPLNGIL
jgi:hypothetical protein